MNEHWKALLNNVCDAMEDNDRQTERLDDACDALAKAYLKETAGLAIGDKLVYKGATHVIEKAFIGGSRDITAYLRMRGSDGKTYHINVPVDDLAEEVGVQKTSKVAVRLNYTPVLYKNYDSLQDAAEDLANTCHAHIESDVGDADHQCPIGATECPHGWVCSLVTQEEWESVLEKV